MKSTQRGVTVVGMVLIAGLIVFGAVLALKLVPAYVEYATVKNHVRELARAPDTRSASNQEIISAFNRRAQIDDVRVVTGADLTILREGGDVILSAEWSTRIPLVGNISACIDFEANSE